MAAREEPDEVQGHHPGEPGGRGAQPGTGRRRPQSDDAGLVEYFKHSRARTFGTLDGWVRRRLRSILRKQQKRQGGARPNGADQIRWPNAYFLGLSNLRRTHEAARQSS
jgi:hypothetical protein